MRDVCFLTINIYRPLRIAIRLTAIIMKMKIVIRLFIKKKKSKKTFVQKEEFVYNFVQSNETSVNPYIMIPDIPRPHNSLFAYFITG